jgi:ubiquinone/menaquinone biosynthesis C-methylase UbiE
MRGRRVGMEEVETYYDEKSKSYDETFSILYFRVFDAITWKYLEPYLPTNPNALVLDAGGGTGRWAVRMAKKVQGKIILMDISEGMLKIATERIKQEQLDDKIIIRKGDITRTNFPNETFDLIFCEHTLFLFKEADTLLKEFKRILKRKARVIVSALNLYVQTLACLSNNPDTENMKNALKMLLREKYNYLDNGQKMKIYTWAPSEFIDMLERNGFHVEKIVGKGYTMPLRISKDAYMKKDYSKDLFEKILQFELALCEKPDTLALAGHMQAIAHKE